jgi:hypothetical protein
MDGRTYLEKLIVDQLQAGREQPEAGRRLGFNLVEIQGTAAGLVAAGALSRNESEQIVSNLNQTLRQSGRLEHHQFNVGSVASPAKSPTT